MVKQRVLGPSRENGLTDDEVDTEAVLDECGVRLLGPRPWTPDQTDALSLASVGFELQRMRKLIRALVDAQTRLALKTGCPGRGTRGLHQRDCPWLNLAAEGVNPLPPEAA